MRGGGVTKLQSLISFLGIYVLGRDTAVYSGSVIDVFARLEVSEEAVRSTLTRMVKRGLLARHRQGRKVYFGLTAHAAEVLEDGSRRIWETGAVNHDWDGTWTLVGFSLPDSERSTRHDLRSQLVWAGFGLLQSGLWIAPGTKDVVGILEPLELGDYVTVLTARAYKPTEAADLVRKAFDTDEIAVRYRAFLERWDTAEPLPEAPDDLARQLLLHTDWRSSSGRIRTFPPSTCLMTGRRSGRSTCSTRWRAPTSRARGRWRQPYWMSLRSSEPGDRPCAASAPGLPAIGGDLQAQWVGQDDGLADAPGLLV